MSLDAQTRELLVLAAARRSGALDALVTDAGTPDDLAAVTDLSLDASEVIITALADCGYLESVGDSYEPTNRLLGFLTKTDIRSIGALPATLDELDSWTVFPESADHENHEVNALGEQWAREDAEVRAAVTAAVREQQGEEVICLRDGPGPHAREFAARGWDATVLETEARATRLRPLFATAAPRLETGGPDGIPDADLVFGRSFLEQRDDATVGRWLDTLAPETPLVLVERLRDRISDGGLADAAAFVHHGGRVRTEHAVRELFSAAGRSLSVREIPGHDAVALVGRRVQ